MEEIFEIFLCILVFGPPIISIQDKKSWSWSTSYSSPDTIITFPISILVGVGVGYLISLLFPDAKFWPIPIAYAAYIYTFYKIDEGFRDFWGFEKEDDDCG